MATALPCGARIGGRYEVESLLGAGGMATVHRARDLETGVLCAIKVLRDPKGELGPRFLREARIAAALAHPNIARVHEVLELEDGAPAIVMELLFGESLGQRLSRVGKMTPGQISTIALAIVAAIRAAHERGVVHRDLKPDNVFLCDDGTVKVLDFGIAKVTLDSADPAITAAALTETGQILGTPQYMAPEQIFGERDIDARADVWALGVILYEALSGARPFEGENAGQVFKAIALDPPIPLGERVPDAPRELVALVSSMVVHARSERLADLGRVADVLEAVIARDGGREPTLAGDGPAVPVVRAPPSPGAPSGRARARAAIVIGGALLAAGVAVRAVVPSSVRQNASPTARAPSPELPPEPPVAAATSMPAPRQEPPPVAAVASSPPETRSSARATSTLVPAGRRPGASAESTPIRPVPVATASDAGARHRSGGLRRDEF